MKWLAVDYGDSRTGLAGCDAGETITSPITPQIEENSMNMVAAAVTEVFAARGAEGLGCGLPKNMDGTEGSRANKSRRYAQRTGSIMSQGNPRNYLDRSEYLLEWTTTFAARGDTLRAEGLLNDAIENLAEKDRFDLSTPAQQQRYRTACRACADAYRDLAQRTGRRSMLLRAALLRLGLPVYQAFLKHKA